MENASPIYVIFSTGDVDSMQQIKIPRMMRDVDWFTNTCTVAYGLIGEYTIFFSNSNIQNYT